MKKVMVLGASYLQTFIIRKIKEMGHYCIALDAKADSEGFQLADKFFVCSTTDLEGVLEIARNENIDGIMTYASDVAAPTVAYVAQELKLPTNPYVSVDILTDKAKTRAFMSEHGFHVPQSVEVVSCEAASEAAARIGFPVIIKPTDASGSKGVSRVDSAEGVKDAFEYAKAFSRTKQVIVETFIERVGYQIDADCFMYNGELVYFNPMDQHQDKIAPYSPIGISAPSVQDAQKTEQAFREVERFLKLLNMQFGQYNVEYIFDKNNQLYILEIGPRSGGNLIPDVIRQGTGLDLSYYNVLAHLGEDCSEMRNVPFIENVTSFILHSQEDGEFIGLEMDQEIADTIQFMKLFVEPGDPVKRFTNGIYAIGFCLMKFADHDLMLRVLDNSAEYIKVKVKK